MEMKKTIYNFDFPCLLLSQKVQFDVVCIAYCLNYFLLFSLCQKEKETLFDRQQCFAMHDD